MQSHSSFCFLFQLIICINIWVKRPLWIVLQRKVPIDVTISMSWQMYRTSLICWSCYDINSTMNKQVLTINGFGFANFINFFLPIFKEWVVFAKCGTMQWENNKLKHVSHSPIQSIFINACTFISFWLLPKRIKNNKHSCTYRSASTTVNILPCLFHLSF